MKRILIIISLVLSVVELTAQSKPAYSTQNYVGLLTGGSGSNFQVQTINGLSFRQWFVGLGTGIDWYYQRSIPVFLSAERGFGIGSNRKIYFSSSVGANFSWNNREDYYHIWGNGSSKFNPGLYWSAGFGYRIPVGKRNDALLFHVGYSNKFYKEKRHFTYECLIPPCPGSDETFEYNLRALSMKLGWGF